MIPILYKSTEKDFNHNGLGQMIEMIEATVTEQRNGEFEFYGEYPVSGRLYDSIDDFMFIKAKPNSVDDPHVFRIYEHELDINTQTVLLYATSKSNDLGSNMVTDVTINNETPLEAMNKMKNNLIEPTDYMFYSDISTRSSTKWTRRNPLNCIAGEEGSLLQFWGGEIKRSNTVISLFSRRGKDNVTTIRHGKNLTGLTMNYSTKGMVTLIVPFFTHTPEGRDEEETIIGTHVKSQYINNYPLSYIKEVDYSQDDDVKDLATLNTKASKYFQENTGIDVPTLSATVNIDDLSDSSEYAKFKNLENIELTDTITVYAKKYKVNITAKVNSLTYDVLADRNRELEIGSIRNTFFDDNVRQVKDLIRETEVTLINTIELAANGKNKVFRGVDEPLTGMSMNDLWYKPVGSGEVEMYIFDGAYWQLEAYSGDAIKGTVNFANVNAINLNLNALTTATISGANMQLDLIDGSQTFYNPNNKNTLLIKQDKFYFDTPTASHYLIPDNEGLAVVPGSGNTGNDRNAGIRLQSTNFNFYDMGYGSDGGFLHRIGSYPDTLALINKDGGSFTFSHTATLDEANANTRRWDMDIGLYGRFKYGKSALEFNGYDSSTVPKVRVVNPLTSKLATLDTGYLNIGNDDGKVELSSTGSDLIIKHGVNRNWLLAQGNYGSITYGLTRLALNGHESNDAARLSVYNATNGQYGYVSAAAFNVQSERESKDDVQKYNGGLSLLASMNFYEYEKYGIREIGLITDESPLQVLAEKETKVSLYSLTSVVGKSTQELAEIVYQLIETVEKQDARIAQLEE